MLAARRAFAPLVSRSWSTQVCAAASVAAAGVQNPTPTSAEEGQGEMNTNRFFLPDLMSVTLVTARAWFVVLFAQSLAGWL